MRYPRFFAATMGLAFAFAPCAWADIYAQRLPDGRVVFTDSPSGEQFRMIIRESPPPANAPASWQEFAHHEARRSHLDPKLVRAVIYVESGENPDAVSPKGAMGLMQLMPGTAKDMGVDNPLHPRQNIKGGVQYLAQMIDRFDGNVRLALAAYNAGPGAVERFNGIPPFKETRDFVEKVLRVYRKAKET